MGAELSPRGHREQCAEVAQEVREGTAHVLVLRECEIWSRWWRGTKLERLGWIPDAGWAQLELGLRRCQRGHCRALEHRAGVGGETVQGRSGG